MKNLIKSPIVFAAGLLALTSSFATGTTILIDLGLNTQETTGNWNNASAAVSNLPAAMTELIDSDGNATTIDLTLAKSFSTAANIAGTAANWDGDYPAMLVGVPASALRDGLFVQQGGKATLTFSGLNPAWTYDCTFYGARGNNGGGARYELIGASTNVATISNVFQNSTDVATFTGISPSAGGVITLEITQVTSDLQGSLNFIRIDAIPEPSVIGLAGLGMLGLLRRRR